MGLTIDAADVETSASAVLLRRDALSVQAQLARTYFEPRDTQRELRIVR